MGHLAREGLYSLALLYCATCVSYCVVLFVAVTRSCVWWLQLTEYNAHCVENSQKQNKQIELLSRQLSESHNQQQLLLQRLQQLQHLSRDDDVKQQSSSQQPSSSSPVLVNGCAHQSPSKSATETDQVCRYAEANAHIHALGFCARQHIC